MNTENHLISERLNSHKNPVAIIDDLGSYSYARLVARAEEVARGLLREREDLGETRIAFLLLPGFEYVAVLLGIWLAGGIAVPLGRKYPPAELDYFLADSDPEAIISDRHYSDRVRDVARRRNIQVYMPGSLTATPLSPLPAIDSARRAMILYTSGATGRPKGVVSTHFNISSQIRCLVSAWDWSGEDRALHILPLHHVHGIINVLCCALWVGATCRMLPRFEPSRVYESIVSEKITTFMAVPTIYAKLISAWEDWELEQKERFSRACSQMRLMVSGSAALPVSIAEKWKRISGHTLLERYGMTEIGMALSNPLHGERRIGTVGKALPGVKVRVVDNRGRTIAEENTPGEILVRGSSVFQEYWKKEEITHLAFQNGWFRTGDVAVLENGYYRILGRNSVDIIKTGGYKVSALEIEEVLRSHPGIKECAVVGVEDEEWGERVSSVVTLEPGHALDMQQLRNWAADKLANYKIPTRLCVVDNLPRNAMGKVRKPELKGLFQTAPGSLNKES